MKRKSPKNHRRRQRAAIKNSGWSTIVTLGNMTFDGSDTVYFYDQAPNTDTITFPTDSFSGSGFAAGDIITISGGTEAKTSKKVHPARRRIPKQNNNGRWIITEVDSSNCITVEAANNLYNPWKDWMVEVSGCAE